MVEATAPITYHLDGVYRTIETGARLRLVNPASLPKGSAVRACYDRSNKKDWAGRQWSVVTCPDGHQLVVLREGLRRV